MHNLVRDVITAHLFFSEKERKSHRSVCSNISFRILLDWFHKFYNSKY